VARVQGADLMARDQTVEQRIETILYAHGISNSGEIATGIWEEIKEDQVDFIAQEVSLREEITTLKTVLGESRDHHEYCGWGDSWERECAEPLQKKIDEVLS